MWSWIGSCAIFPTERGERFILYQEETQGLNLIAKDQVMVKLFTYQKKYSNLHLPLESMANSCLDLVTCCLSETSTVCIVRQGGCQSQLWTLPPTPARGTHKKQMNFYGIVCFFLFFSSCIPVKSTLMIKWIKSKYFTIQRKRQSLSSVEYYLQSCTVSYSHATIQKIHSSLYVI